MKKLYGKQKYKILNYIYKNFRKKLIEIKREFDQSNLLPSQFFSYLMQKKFKIYYVLFSRRIFLYFSGKKNTDYIVTII